MCGGGVVEVKVCGCGVGGIELCGVGLWGRVVVVEVCGGVVLEP